MRTGSAMLRPLLPTLALVCAVVLAAAALPRSASAAGETLEVTAARLEAHAEDGLVVSADVALALPGLAAPLALHVAPNEEWAVQGAAPPTLARKTPFTPPYS